MPTRANNQIKDPSKRILYVSWEPDDLKLGVSWVRGFKEKVEPIDRDEAGKTIEKLFPGDLKAGEIETDVLRDMRAKATDVVIVVTSHYIMHQKNEISNKGVSELLEFIQRKDGDVSNTLIIWLAPLEEVKLHRYKLDQRYLDVFRWWHWLKEQRFMLPGNLEEVQHNAEFMGEIGQAVERLLSHGINRCEECPKSVAEGSNYAACESATTLPKENLLGIIRRN